MISTGLALSEAEITDGIRTESMRIEEGAAEVPWCVSCGIIMMLATTDATISQPQKVVARALVCLC